MTARLLVHDEGVRLLVRVYEDARPVAGVELSAIDALRLALDLLAAGLRHLRRLPA